MTLGIAPELTHYKLQRYMRAFASYHGLNSNDANPNVTYNTRVELIEKKISAEGEGQGWTLTLKKLVRTGKDRSKATWWTEVGISPRRD